MKSPDIRLHESFPPEILTNGKQLEVRAGISRSPFGECLIAESPLGICHLSWSDGGGPEGALAALRTRWPGALLVWDHQRASESVNRIFSHVRGDGWDVHVRGTPFQIRVWRALLSIPFGKVMTYGQLAKAVGLPGASRAIGSALGKNEVSILIPCHRVVRADGTRGQYRWGAVRKAAILEWEAALAANTPFPG